MTEEAIARVDLDALEKLAKAATPGPYAITAGFVPGELAVDDTAYRMVQTYGTDAAEWLRRWDAGDGVWTITMGGLSAGYDQAINLIAAEFVRALVKLAPEPGEFTDELRTQVSEECAQAASTLGLSGAQHGAALGMAWRLYSLGPVKAIGSAPDDRRIQASKGYPTLDPVILAAITASKATTAGESGAVGMKPLQAAECTKENTKEMGHE